MMESPQWLQFCLVASVFKEDCSPLMNGLSVCKSVFASVYLPVCHCHVIRDPAF